MKSMVGVLNIGRKTSDKMRHDFIQMGLDVFRGKSAVRDNGSTKVRIVYRRK